MVFNIEVNNKTIKANKGETILAAITRNGIKVPTLCHLQNFIPTGACRMCVVEIEGRTDLIPACSHPVEEWMKIKTHSQKVLKARKTILELLLSNHPDDCLFCERTGKCELQNFVEEFNLTERRFYGKKSMFKTDQTSLGISRDPAKCILCGRCVRVCEEIEHVSALDFTGRGSKAFISPAFNKGLSMSSCTNCGQCVLVCPTGALHDNSHLEKVISALNNNNLTQIVSFSPAISVSIADELGLKPGADIQGILNATFRKIGFKKVFNGTFAADIATIEMAAEIIEKIKNNDKLPVISSNCSAWIKFAEKSKHNLLNNISSIKSQQQIMGALIKNYIAQNENLDVDKIYNVSITPCTARKHEAQREEMKTNGMSDVDAVLTTRELVKLFNIYGIDIKQIEPEQPDSPFTLRSSAGKLYANSGGLTESVLRTIHFNITGNEYPNYRIDSLRGNDNKKEAKFIFGEFEINVAVVNGLANAVSLLKEIENGNKNIHFIEIMACPGGCIGGGGQPILKDAKAVKSRAQTIYEIDKLDPVRAAHQNHEIKELYSNYIQKPLSEISKKLFYTTYSPKK